MNINLTYSTKNYIKSELYKVCAGEDVTKIIGQYNHNSIWQPHDIVKTLIHACSENTSVEDICNEFPGPSADTIHRRVNELQLEQIEQLINNLLQETVSRLKFHANTKLTVSFDDHTMPYYGDRSREWITGSKKQKGTHYCTMFTVVCITSGTIRCPVYILFMTKNRRKNIYKHIEKIMDELEMWLPVQRVLMDRWYHQSKIIDELEFRGQEFIIAAIKKGNVKRKHQVVLDTVKSLAEVEGIDTDDNLTLGRWARKQGIHNYRIEKVAINRKGTRVPLVATFLYHKVNNKNSLKKPNYSLVVYLTNIDVSCEQIIRIYRRRWLIETDMRCIGEFQALTNSRQGNIRIFLFGLAMLLDALWVVITVLMNRIKDKGELIVTEESVFMIYQRNKLLIIARSFRRYIRLKIMPNFSFKGGDA